LPVVNELAAKYGDQIDFVAPAWKGTSEATAAAGSSFFPTGDVLWGLDEDEDIFSKFGIPYQPVTILIAHDRTVFTEWAGLRDPAEVEALIDELIVLAG